MYMLLITDGHVHHYVLIKDITKFVCSMDSLHYKTAMQFCRNCLHLFGNEEILKQHLKSCRDFEPASIQMPSEKSKEFKFNNIKALWFAPLVVYFDFESFLANPSEPSPTSNTEILEVHQPSGYAFVLVDHFQEHPIHFELDSGPDCIKKFIINLHKLARDVYRAKRKFPIYNGVQPPVSEASEKMCWICQKLVEESDRVLDHCHYSGKFLGVCHSRCNLSRRNLNFTPVIAHNLQNYDLHHIILALDVCEPSTTVNVIPLSDEKFISLSLGVLVDTYERDGQTVRIYETLRFIDSFKFMGASLERLVSNLPVNTMKLLENYFASKRDDMHLLYRKGYYPYSHMDGPERFNETKLPEFSMWKNSLSGDEISITQSEFEQALKVFNSFKCRNLKDYHDLYLTVDTLQLACVFEQFRRTPHKSYGLDAAQYFSASNLSGDAYLKLCDARIELITNREHLEIAENLKRGGVASVFSNRFFQANNKLLDNYDETEPSTFGFMIDANNLYGGIMEKEFLPLSGFKIMETFDLECLLSTPSDSDVGYILELDLEYPEELHDLHSDFPLAPEKTVVEELWLSPYQKALRNRMRTNVQKSKKLLQTLHKKFNYTVHYRTLQLYVQLGLKITKVHRVLQFRQSKWLQPYVTYNGELRKQSSNRFEQDFYKLMNNSAYGKTCESKRNRNRLFILRTREEVLEKVAKPTMSSFKIFGENLASVSFRPTKILMNRPCIVGAVILDLAKRVMFDFHYNVMKKNFQCSLLYSDTDSLLYNVHSSDLYEELQSKNLLDQFDFSNFPDTHPLFDTRNKMVTLKMKDEFAGNILSEFVALKPKLYSVIASGNTHVSVTFDLLINTLFFFFLDSTRKQSAKGITKYAQCSLTHEKYKAVLSSGSVVKTENTRIVSLDHQLVTLSTHKVSLSAYDDKRYICLDGIKTLPYGHFELRELRFRETFDFYSIDSSPKTPFVNLSPSSPSLPVLSINSDDFVDENLLDVDRMNEDTDPGLNENEFFNLICQSPEWGNFDEQPILESQATLDPVPSSSLLVNPSVTPSTPTCSKKGKRVVRKPQTGKQPRSEFMFQNLMPSDSQLEQPAVFDLLSDTSFNTPDPGLFQCNFGESDLDSSDVVNFDESFSESLSPITNPFILHEADVNSSDTDSDIVQVKRV